jgi:shikimate kinase
MKSNIALIGFMGTGKTAVGQVLAKRLNRQLFEVDEVIKKTAGKTISQIFNNDGEIVFRELEIEAIKKAAAMEKQIIACGGGVVLNTINIDRLRTKGVVINLTASPEIILKRIAHDKDNRPLINADWPPERIKELMKFRKPFYDRAVDITVNTSKLTIDAAADEIIDRLKKYEGFNF